MILGRPRSVQSPAQTGPPPMPGHPGTRRSASGGSAVDRSSPQRADRVPRTPGTVRGPCPIRRAEPLPRPLPRASAEKELPRRREVRGSPPSRSPSSRSPLSGGGFGPRLSPSRPFRPRWGRTGHYEGAILSTEKARKPPGIVMPASWIPSRRVPSRSTPPFAKGNIPDSTGRGFRAPTAPRPSAEKQRPPSTEQAQKSRRITGVIRLLDGDARRGLNLAP